MSIEEPRVDSVNWIRSRRSGLIFMALACVLAILGYSLWPAAERAKIVTSDGRVIYATPEETQKMAEVLGVTDDLRRKELAQQRAPSVLYSGALLAFVVGLGLLVVPRRSVAPMRSAEAEPGEIARSAS